ncbi:hypothetical protein EG68_08687 [Paragonimus skrjabini miyazakii]|uniref:Uncharacterized protein n=1 Tax=Paragonimus skrjabini miyazakii TaxID=59628 RepID=A0A8S9YJK1_9TREM|nr:hypothetical protein EG68_08687 [Paragonimus skrjabini miyazakii]
MDFSDCQGLAAATNSPDTTSFTFKCDVGPQEAVHHKVSSAEISSTKNSMNQSPNDSVRTDMDLFPKAGSESPTTNQNSHSEVPCFSDSRPPSPSSDTPLPDSTTTRASDLEGGVVTASSLTPMSSQTIAIYPESVACVLAHEVTQSVTETGLNMESSSSTTLDTPAVHCDSSEQRSPDTSHISSPVQSSTTLNTEFSIDLDTQAESFDPVRDVADSSVISIASAQSSENSVPEPSLINLPSAPVKTISLSADSPAATATSSALDQSCDEISNAVTQLTFTAFDPDSCKPSNLNCSSQLQPTGITGCTNTPLLPLSLPSTPTPILPPQRLPQLTTQSCATDIQLPPMISNSDLIVPTTSIAPGPGVSMLDSAKVTFSHLPHTTATAPLPPFFLLTLVPITPSGDFPAVQLNLPDLPTVILQVLPLPGAKMGEQYTIKVPTPLILSAINSALANNGTANGGPIMLSIEPSGVLPPSTSLQSPVLPLQSNLEHNNPGNHLPIMNPATLFSSSTTSSMPFTGLPLPVPSNVITGVGSNGMTTVQLSVPLGSQIPASSSNHSCGNVGKRMRAIAPKPLQKLTVQPSVNGTCASPRTTSCNRAAPKRQVVNSVIATNTTGAISCASITPATYSIAICSPALATMKTKRVSILPISSSSVRSGRGRRKVNAVVSTTSQICSATSVVFTTTHGCPISATGLAPPNETFLAPHGSMSTMVHPTAFTTQPMLVPHTAASMLPAPVLSSGAIPPTFLFGGSFPPCSSHNGGPPYLVPQPFQFPHGCPPFPNSMYASSNCNNALSSATTCQVPIRPIPPVSSASIFPSGASGAMATMDPNTGVVHYPAPYVPMAVPYSSSGQASTDQSPFGLSIVYSQPNQNTLGFILPNVSQAGSLVYPVTGQTMLPSHIPHVSTALSSAAGSIALSEQSHMDQPLSRNLLPGCSLSSSSLPPSSVSSTAIPMSSNLGALLPGSYFAGTCDGSNSLMPLYSVTTGPLTTSNTVSADMTLNEGADGIAKDDLISIAWRLTQMEDGLPVSSDAAEEHRGSNVEESGAEDDSRIFGALFESYAQEKTCDFAYQTMNLPACSDVYSLRSNDISDCEGAEIVLLDAKQPSPLATGSHLVGPVCSETFADSNESTGNADIDALLAAAAMVGAASGVGDAQSAVTVAAPPLFPSTVCQTAANPTTKRPANSVSADTGGSPSVSPQPLSHDQVEAQLSISLVASVSPASVKNTIVRAHVSPSGPTELLSGDLFDGFDGSVCQTTFNNRPTEDVTAFDETDEPTSLVAALGCTAEDAADLESVLGPQSHGLSGAGHVSESFLNSLVGTSDLSLNDEVDQGHIFDTDFDVCPSATSEHSADRECDVLVACDNRLTESLNELTATNFDLDYEALTKDSANADPPSDTEMPIPSSHQVRALLRNTVPTVVPFRFGASRSGLTSEERKVFGRLFGTVNRKRGNQTCRFSAEATDDFLGVDFPDATGEYTTAEQFDAALMLLGPPPSSPSKSLKEFEMSPKSENVLRSVAETTNLSPMTVGQMAVPLNRSLSPSIVNAILVEPVESGKLHAVDVPPAGVSTVETPSGSVSPSHAETNKTPVISKSATEEFISLAVTVENNSKLINSNTPDRVVGDLSVTNIFEIPITNVKPDEDVEDTKICDVNNSQQSSQFPEGDVECENEDETMAMRLEQSNQSTSERSVNMTPKHSGCSPVRVISSDFIHLDVCKRLHSDASCGSFRRRTFSATLSNVCSVVSTPSSTDGFCRRLRRRLVSAPTVCTRSSHKIDSPFPLSIQKPLESKQVSPIQLTSEEIFSTSISPKNVLHNANAVQGSPSPLLSQSPNSERADDVPQSIQSPSILGVLASSTALLEAAVDLGSDSDISPIKSNIEGLATLDRMLKSCQKRSLQSLDSSESKSVSIVSSSENPVCSASQASESSDPCDKPLIATEVSVASPVQITLTDYSEKQSAEHSPTDQTQRCVRRSKQKKKTRKKPSQFRKSSPRHVPSEPSSDEIFHNTVQVEPLTTEPAFLVQTPSPFPSSDGLWLFPSSERPLSFGFSVDSVTNSCTGSFPLAEGDFEQHLPRLTLAVEGRLFPNCSEADEPINIGPTVDTDVSEGMEVTQSVPLYTVGEYFQESTKDSASIAIKRYPARRKLRKRRRPKHFSKDQKQIFTPTHSTPTTDVSSMHACMNPVHITPVSLCHPTDSAPFSRFLHASDLPSFTTVQLSSQPTQLTSSNTHKQVWASNDVLFSEFMKAHSGQSKPSDSVQTTDFDTESIDRTSPFLNSGTQNTLDVPYGIDNCARSASQLIHPSAPASHSSTVSSGFSAPAFPNLHVNAQSVSSANSFSSTPNRSWSPVPSNSTPNPSRLPTVALSSASDTPTLFSNCSVITQSALSVPTQWPPAPFVEDISLTSKLPNASLLSVQATQFPGLTFGSFAGAAAFRATSFSALAARAATTQSAPLWTDIPSFSDLANAAMNGQEGSNVIHPQSSAPGFHRPAPTEEHQCRLFNRFVKTASSERADQATVDLQPNNKVVSEPVPASDRTQLDEKSVVENVSLPIVEQNVSIVTSSPMLASSFEANPARLNSLNESHCASDRIHRRRRGFRKLRAKGSKSRLYINVKKNYPSVVQNSSPPPICGSPALSPIHPKYPVCLITRLEHSFDCPSPTDNNFAPSIHVSSPKATSNETSNPAIPQQALELFERDLQTSTSQEPEPFADEVAELSTTTPFEVIDVSSFTFGGVSNTDFINVNVPTSHTDDFLEATSFGPPKDQENDVPVTSATSPDPIFASSCSPKCTTLSNEETTECAILGVAQLTKTSVEQIAETANHESPAISCSSETGDVRPNDDLSASKTGANDSLLLHPPIKLRLNLKSTSLNPVRGINRKGLSPPTTKHLIPPTVPVIAASTATSLSIRFRRFATPNDPPVALSNRKRKKQKNRKLPSNQLSAVSTQPNITMNKMLNDGQSLCRKVTNDLPPNTTAKAIKLTIHNPSSNPATVATRSSLPNRSAIVRPPHLASVFSKKIFSTAKQDRRSSYAQLSRPWRSGLSGSPRKRGHSRNHFSKSTTVCTSVPVEIKRPRMNPANSSTVNNFTRGSSKRGRPPTRARARSRVCRNDRNHLVNNVQIVKEKTARNDRPILDTIDPPAIRMIIRLGKSLSAKTDVMGNAQLTTVLPPVVQTQSDGSPSRYSDTSSHESCDPQAMDSESFDDSRVDEMGGTVLKPLDELSSFAFCIATEAETYVDPNQVQIHRTVNRALRFQVAATENMPGYFAQSVGSDEVDVNGCHESRRVLNPDVSVKHSCKQDLRVLDSGSQFAGRSTESCHGNSPSARRQIHKATRTSRNQRLDADWGLHTGLTVDDHSQSLTDGLHSNVYKHPSDLKTSKSLTSTQLPNNLPECSPTSRSFLNKLNTDQEVDPEQFANNYLLDESCGANSHRRHLRTADPQSWQSGYLEISRLDSSPLDKMTPAGQKHGLEVINLKHPHHSNELIGHSFGGVPEGRSSSSTSSIVSVQPPPSAGSPTALVGRAPSLGPTLDNPLETAFLGSSHRADRMHQSSKFTCADPISTSTCDPLMNSCHKDSLSEYSRHSSLQQTSPSTHRYSSVPPETVTITSPRGRHYVEPAPEQQSLRPFESEEDSGSVTSPPSSVQQQALALAAAAAYATLDPRMAVHRQAKAYYDQWASSLFGNWAAGANSASAPLVSDPLHSAQTRQEWVNPSLFPPKQNNPDSHYDQIQPCRRISGNQKDVEETCKHWQWENPRPAHLSDHVEATRDNLSQASDSSRYGYPQVAPPNQGTDLLIDNSQLPTDTASLSRLSSNAQHLSNNCVYSSQNHPADRYGHFPLSTSVDYGRVGVGPLHEPQINNGW